MTNARLIVLMTGLTALGLAIVVVLLNAMSVNQSATVEQMLSSEDLAQLNAQRAAFGLESDPVLIAIDSPDAIPPARLMALELALREIPQVADTLSSAALGAGAGSPAMRFSLPAGSGLVVVFLRSGLSGLQAAQQVSAHIDKTVNAHITSQQTAAIVGLPQIRVASWQITRSDMVIVLPMLLLITMLVTLGFFRSYAAMLLALLLTSLTTALCLLFQFRLASQLSTLMVVVIPVIWAIATLDAFHLYSRAALRSRQQHPHPVNAACAEIFVPCLLTTITTAACFLTLTLLDTSPLIVSLGAWGAVGACIAFLLTFTLGRWLLSHHHFGELQRRWPSRFSYQLVWHSERYRTVVISLWALAVMVSLIVFPRLHIASLFPQVFASGMPIAQDIARLQRVSGTDLTPIDLMLEPNDAHGAQSQRMASAALLTSHYLTTLPETRLVLPIDLVDQERLQQIAESWPEGGGTGAALAVQAEELASWFNPRRNAVRVQWHLAPTELHRKQELLDWIAHFDTTMLNHHSITVSGAGYFYPLTEQRGAASLLTTSVLSLFIIGLTMMWITRSPASAVVALSGSVVPAIVLAGCMAVLGLPWSVALLALPVVLLGLMNDDTIHIIWSSKRMSQRRKAHEKNGSKSDGAGGRHAQGYLAQRRYRHNAIVAGPALLATTTLLAAAVATLMLTGIRTNQYLGLLIPLGLLMAFAANLTLLPALSSYLHKSVQLQR